MYAFSCKFRKAVLGIIGSVIIVGTPLSAKAESPINNSSSKALAPINQTEEAPVLQKISVFAGISTNGKELVYTGSYSVMQFEYLFEFLKEKWSISYINEGQFSNPKHHRDGFVGQYWVKKGYFSAGAGGYLYFDTTEDQSNVHGLGGILSLNVEYPITTNLSGNLRANLVSAREMTTVSFMAGLSYNFAPQKDSKENISQEITIFPAGYSFSGSYLGGSSFSYAAEYRLNVYKNIDWTVAYLDEKIRNGVNSQLWAIKKLDKFSLGIGAGVYLADRTDLIISITGEYDLSEKFNLRATFSRVATNDSNDADVALLGLGYKF